MPAGRPGKPGKMRELRAMRPRQPKPEGFGRYARQFLKRFGNVENAKKFAKFRMRELGRGRMPRERAMIEVMKELGRRPQIRPFLDDERRGWIVQREVRRDKWGRWIGTTVYRSGEERVWNNNDHLSPDVDIGNVPKGTPVPRVIRTETHAPSYQAEAEPPEMPILRVVEQLRTVERAWGKPLGRARHNYGRAVELALTIEGGKALVEDSDQAIRAKSVKGPKSEFNAILNRTLRLVEFISNSRKPNEKK